MTNQTLKGRVAIVTGGSRGIGAATVVELASRGAKVAFTYVSPSSTERSLEVIARVAALDNGSSATAIHADMADRNAPSKIVQETLAAFATDTIDILVNNAAVNKSAPLMQYTHELYESIFDVNVRGSIFLAQAVIPHLPATGGGRIINIGSLASRISVPYSAIMSASKAALEAFTRVWASELGPRSHAVNYVAVGATETEGFTRSGENPAALVAMERAKSDTPYEQRWGQPQDVALVIAMLAEPQSRWITGQCISASGGLGMF